MRTFSCDIETDGIDATVVWCIAVHNIDTDQVITFAGPCLNLFKPWMESEADRLIFHNGISFDVPVLEKLLDLDFSDVLIEDTLVMSQLYKPRLDGGHSLSSISSPTREEPFRVTSETVQDLQGRVIQGH